MAKGVPKTLEGRLAQLERAKKMGKNNKGSSRIPWNKGIPPSAETRALISKLAIERGCRPPVQSGTWTPKQRANILKARKGKPSPHMRGAANPNWRGGFHSEAKSIRFSFEYKEWRKHVFQRDLYTCQACGTIGGQLHADHELSFSDYPNLRLEILNGRTLCKPCHIKTDTWGGRTKAKALAERFGKVLRKDPTLFRMRQLLG